MTDDNIMKSKVTKINDSTIKLTVTISAPEMVKYFKQSYSKLALGVKIDGFRPGKAPRKLVESAVGVSRILSEALDAAVSENYYKAIVENKLIPISQPKVVINNYPDYGQSTEEIKNDFEFEAELETMPEITLSDYSKVKVEKGKPNLATEADVEKVIDHFKKQAATFTEIDRPAEKGDHAEITFEGFLKHVRIDKMCSKNHPLILGEGSLIPGFEENITGMKKAETKEFKIKFPAGYQSKEFAGKEAEFKVTLNNLKKVDLPEVDDVFAMKFGHKNAEVLTKAIRENLNKEYEDEFKREIENRVLDAILPHLKAKIPETLVDREAERMLSGYAEQLQKQGVNFENYLLSTKNTKEKLLLEMRPHAERNVKIGLLLGEVIKEIKMDPAKHESADKAMQYLIKKVIK